MMLLTLEKYFLIYGHLILPGIGQLRFDQRDASHTNEQFTPPIETIQFDNLESSQTKPSKLFYIFLSDHLDCSVEQAIIEYSNFLTNQLNDDHCIDLGNLGKLILDNHIYTYHSNFKSTDYYKELKFVKVLNEDQNENNFNSTNKKWWLYPLIIAIIALVAIFLK